MKLTRRPASGPGQRPTGPIPARTPAGDEGVRVDASADGKQVRQPSPSQLLARPGAVAGAAPDAGVAAHYGRPANEQRALEDGRAVVDLTHLSVLAVSGNDRLSWLHSLTTQHLSDLVTGESTELLVLDPHGHVEHAAAVVDDGERTWLIAEAADGPALAEFLDSMRFNLDVGVERRDDIAVLGVGGSGLERAASAANAMLTWRDPWPATRAGSTTYGAPDSAHPGREVPRGLLLVQRDALADTARALDADEMSWAGVWAWEAMRVAALRPRLSREVDARTLPHEVDWLRTAVHLTKGCYRGQESVARIINLGRPPRRLVLLHLDGSQDHLPGPGAQVLAGNRPVGTVTSAVRHMDDGPIALALVRRAVDPTAILEVDGVAAAQETIVGTDGEPAHRPASPDRAALRRRDLGRPGA